MDEVASTALPVAKPKITGFIGLLKQTFGFVRERLGALVVLVLLPVVVRSVSYFIPTTAPAWSHVVVALFSFLLQTICAVALLVLLSKRDSNLTLEQVLEIAANKTPGYLLQLVIVLAILTGPYVLLVIPGIIVSVWIMFTSSVYVNEGTSVLTSILRSREYVRGYWWAVLGRMTLLGLLSLAFPLFGGLLIYTLSRVFVSLAILGVVISIGYFLVLTLVFWIIVCPFMFFMYESLRSIKGASIISKPGPKKSFIALAVFGLLLWAALIASVIFVNTYDGASPNSEYLNAYETNPVYTYEGGYFAPTIDIYKNNYREVKESGGNVFTYVETLRDSDYLYLFDQSRNIVIQLPREGGQSYFSIDGGQTWTPLYIVTIVTKQ